jgi:hypothetical protein
MPTQRVPISHDAAPANQRELCRLWTEYVELPGLRLTREQARRFCSVDDRVCTQLLDSLVNARLLVRGPDGRYARRHESGALSPLRMAKADIEPRVKSSVRQVG